MDILAHVSNQLGKSWIPAIYAERIRTLRTRSYDLPVSEKENQPVVLHTLLGVELKVGRSRLTCPDLGTARYLAVFAAAGCQKVAVPYDITLIPALADEIEAAWHRTIDIFERSTADLAPQAAGKARARLIRAIRDEIAKIGAGEMMPLFNTSTRQRDS